MFDKTKLKLTLIVAVAVASVAALVYVPIHLGLDLQGGMYVVLEAKSTATVKVDENALLGAISVIRNRVDALGVSEPIIQQKGQNQIVVELPGVKDPQKAMALIGDTALLEFAEAEWAPPNVQELTPDKLAILAGPHARLDVVVDSDAQGQKVSERPIILKETALTGADLKNALPSTDQYGKPVVDIEFTSEGARKFYNATAKSVGKPLAIMLDKKIISAPNVHEAISGGRAQISGQFSVSEMRDLVIKLKAGALPVPVEVVSSKIVGPTLGKDSIDKSKLAGIVGFVLVVLFMVGFYRIPGVAANVALILYIGMSLAILKLLNVTLTLPGIAGIILTIGMAVDANILIYERIKEERRNGEGLRSAIEKGFQRAFVTILDSNITTLISAVVLFWLGSGSIKGFGVTLGIGILVSMFTAVFVTRVLVDGLAQSSHKDNLFKA